jgi:hypothetical protein
VKTSLSDPILWSSALRRAFHPGSNVTGVIFRGQHAGERVKLLSEFA